MGWLVGLLPHAGCPPSRRGRGGFEEEFEDEEEEEFDDFDDEEEDIDDDFEEEEDEDIDDEIDEEIDDIDIDEDEDDEFDDDDDSTTWTRKKRKKTSTDRARRGECSAHPPRCTGKRGRRTVEAHIAQAYNHAGMAMIGLPFTFAGSTLAMFPDSGS